MLLVQSARRQILPVDLKGDPLFVAHPIINEENSGIIQINLWIVAQVKRMHVLDLSM